MKHEIEISEKLPKLRGAILPPLVLWLVGVPAFVAVLLWLFFFRG